MAKVTSFEQLARRLKKVASNVIENSEDITRKAAIAADSVVVLGTPVDTGRARGNWIATTGSPSSSTVENLDRSGLSSIALAQTVIGRWTEAQGPIFITNNLPYIVPLDGGSSPQAPDGMTKQAIAAAEAQLNGAKLLQER